MPMTDQGASLSLKIEETGSPDILRFRMSLKAAERGVWREVEHRHINALPFLFAFFADGEPVVTKLNEWQKMGGDNKLIMLVKKGAKKTWDLKVSANSIKGLLGNSKPRTLEVVAAFSERQHEAYFDGKAAGLWPDLALVTGYQGSQILIRSNVVKLKWADGKWAVEK
ncbi:MAG: hypothetical protein QGD94_05150 [Planctomycetia bacterium]|nr:hypothetical protein [Planctomycetia bacterium]